MKRKPYKQVKIDGVEYWDYSVKIKRIIYEISVNTKTGTIYINEDEYQGE